MSELVPSLTSSGRGVERAGESRGQDPVVAFKPSHFTRGKDGAPSEQTPPLSSDADKGDQEAVVFSIMPMISGKDYKAREVGVTQPITTNGNLSGNQGADVVVTPIAIGVDQECNAVIEGHGTLKARMLGGGFQDAVAFSHKDNGRDAVQEVAPTIRAMKGVTANSPAGGSAAVAFQPGNLKRRAGSEPSTEQFPTRGSETQGDQAPHVATYENHGHDSRIKPVDVSPQINARAGTGGNNLPLAQSGMVVRRLTPVECCRLQGFKDDWNEWGIDANGNRVQMSDSARYRQMGNAVSVPVANFLARVIKHLISNKPQQEDSHEARRKVVKDVDDQEK